MQKKTRRKIGQKFKIPTASIDEFQENIRKQLKMQHIRLKKNNKIKDANKVDFMAKVPSGLGFTP